jgi:hypothetical protein
MRARGLAQRLACMQVQVGLPSPSPCHAISSGHSHFVSALQTLWVMGPTVLVVGQMLPCVRHIRVHVCGRWRLVPDAVIGTGGNASALTPRCAGQ